MVRGEYGGLHGQLHPTNEHCARHSCEQHGDTDPRVAELWLKYGSTLVRIAQVRGAYASEVPSVCPVLTLASDARSPNRNWLVLRVATVGETPTPPAI